MVDKDPIHLVLVLVVVAHLMEAGTIQVQGAAGAGVSGACIALVVVGAVDVPGGNSMAAQ